MSWRWCPLWIKLLHPNFFPLNCPCAEPGALPVGAAATGAFSGKSNFLSVSNVIFEVGQSWVWR